MQVGERKYLAPEDHPAEERSPCRCGVANLTRNLQDIRPPDIRIYPRMCLASPCVISHHGVSCAPWCLARQSLGLR